MDRNNSAYLEQNTDRIPTASTHGIDPPNHDWNMFALRLDGDFGQVLPPSITDEDLCFQFGSAPFNVAPPSQGLHIETIDLWKSERNFPQESYRTDSDAWSDSGYSTASRPTIAENDTKLDIIDEVELTDEHSEKRLPGTPTSIKNMTSGGERQFRLSEMDRMNARKVRSQGACFRCWYMKEKVRTLDPPRILTDLDVNLLQSAHPDILLARTAEELRNIANFRFG